MRVLQHVVALSFIVLQVATAQTPDGDMELADRGPWAIYGTPVTVEKSTFARGGARSLHVVTDNKDTMGGNYEGTSYSLGARKVGDLVEVSFWFNAKGGQTICVGMGPGYFVNAWWLSGTDWTRADVSLRCPQDGDYTVWISQGSAAAEFYLDDFIVNVTRRPSLGTAAPDRRVTLAGGPLRLSLCRDSGALCGLQNTATGEVYAAAGQRQPLLGLELLREDGLGYERIPFERLRLADLKVEGEGSAELRFGVEGLEIEVAVSVRMGEDGSASFVGTLRNGSARTVTSLELPMVYGLCPAVNPDALTLVHPTVCGQITPKALKSDGCKATYPGQAVMGWLDLSGEQGGVYLATHDSRSLGTRLMALPAPGPSFDMSLTKELPVKPGVTCEFPAAVLAVHTGDWHASADRYRAWAREWMQPPDVPDWLRRSDGWVLTGIQNGLPFRQLPDIYRQAQWMGIDYLHVQGQGIDTIWDGPDGKPRFHDLTYPYPTPRFGTVPELKQAVRRIHDESGHVMFYFLYDRWTPSHSTADDFGSGRRADVPAPYHPPGPEFYPTSALIEQPGKQAPTEHPLGEERMMCLGSPGWQEWMRHWAVDVYAKEYGADGFYWDVMGRNGPFRCFNAAHGHSGESEWAGGCAKVLSNTIAQGRAINPDYSTAIEGCSDVLGQWVGFHLMSGATLTPNVFRYTFPEILCVDGFSNHTFKLTGPQKARRVFLEGERFDLHGYDQRVKKVLNLRRRIKPFMDWPAVFRDTVGLTVSDARVQARLFQRTDGENRALAVTMLNEERVEGATIKVDLQAIGAPRSVHLFRFGGTLEEVEELGDGVQVIPVPADDISAAVIVANVGPELSVVPWMEQMMRPGEDGLALGMFLPGGPMGSLDVDITWPGTPGPLEEVAAEVPNLRRMEILDPTHLTSLARWLRVPARLSWEGGHADVWTMLAPPLVNGDFEYAEDGYLSHWATPPCLEDPGQGKQCIRLDRQTAPAHLIQSLTPVKPNCRYRFRCMVKRGEGATGWAGAHVLEYLEGNEFARSAALNGTKLGEWETLETTFTTHADPRTTAIYLYNFDDTQPAWFDGLELDEVR